MSSKPPSEGSQPFSFAIPATAEDIAWQRRVRRLGIPSFAEYLRLISQEHASIDELSRRKLPIGYEPFEL